ncbi:unnamed protein product, partial [Iphiclides podalirius]
MGDIIEVSTWPNHENVFYEITSSALTFYVKTSRKALIGLSRKPSRVCDYWIVITNYPYSYIKKGSDPRIKVRTPDILNPDTYQKFWIAWNGGFIRLGRMDEKDPLIICCNKVPGLRYVTFDVWSRRETSPVHWKFELPPQLHKPQLMPLLGGEPHWVRAGDQLPDGSFIGGHENEVLYVIRAMHMGSLAPGKFVPSLGLAYVAWGGTANEKSDFEVLCGYNCTWVPCHDDKIPSNAVVGGYAEGEGREKLFVGRVAHEGHLIPGKVQSSHKVCYVPYNGRELPKTHYEVLVSPHGSGRVVNKFFMYGIECDTGSESENEYFEPEVL